MKKKFKKSLFILSFLIFGTVFAAESEEEVKKKILSSFQQIFELKLGQGDRMALRLAEKAKNKAGRLDLDLDDIKRYMLKWDPASKKLFSELKTVKAKVEEVKKEFEELLKKKVKEEDPEAIRIAEKGEANGGELEFSVRQMRELISKWEK